MNETPLQIGKNYFVKVGTAEVTGSVSEIQYQVDVNTLDQTKVKELALNGIARCKLELTEPVIVDSYKQSRHTGNLIFIDRLSNITVGAGMVVESLTGENIVWHQMDVTKQARAGRYSQKPCVVWFTGLSGSGKSTSANALEKALFAMGYNTYLLDGDNVRHGLCGDLGFSDRDRAENIRRVGEVAKLMVDAGHVVLTSFISPFRRERSMVRQMVEPGEFIEVYVKAPLLLCEQRDPKGLYKKARAGLIRDFTGIDSPYEEPEDPEITVDTDGMTVEAVANLLIRKLRGYGIIS